MGKEWGVGGAVLSPFCLSSGSMYYTEHKLNWGGLLLFRHIFIAIFADKWYLHFLLSKCLCALFEMTIGLEQSTVQGLLLSLTSVLENLQLSMALSFLVWCVKHHIV